MVITRCREWPTQSREGTKRQRPGQHRGKSGPPVVWVETQRGPHSGTLRVWGASLNFRAAILWGARAGVWRASGTRRRPELAAPSVPSPGGLTLQAQHPTPTSGPGAPPGSTATLRFGHLSTGLPQVFPRAALEVGPVQELGKRAGKGDEAFGDFLEYSA